MEFSLENEDIHMNIETILTQRIGRTGKRLHTARSRNDQVAVDFRLYVKKEIRSSSAWCGAGGGAGQEGGGQSGHGHAGLHPSPAGAAHHLRPPMMAYANMLKRDVTRLEDCLERMDECPLGAGALATSTYPVDRFQTAAALGFSKPTDNSMDSVSDRDYRH